MSAESCDFLRNECAGKDFHKMATGDLEGNIDRLKAEVRRTKYAGHLDMAGYASFFVLCFKALMYLAADRL